LNQPHPGAMKFLELLAAAKAELEAARAAMKVGDAPSEQRYADAVGAIDRLRGTFAFHDRGLGREQA